LRRRRCARNRHRESATPWRAARIETVANYPLTDEERAQLAAKIHQLEIEHGDLNDVIAKLVLDPEQDQLQLQRLKKRKLLLKDQLERLRARLIPDIIA
jgi:hypothetical protein